MAVSFKSLVNTNGKKMGYLEAVEYYVEHIESINNALLALVSEYAVSIDTAKTAAFNT